LTLQQGSYRFRADYNGTQYWSASSNHCAVPGCMLGTVIVGPQPTATATPTATETPLPTATPIPTDTEEPTAEPSPTPEATATPLALRPGDYAVSFGKPIFAPRQSGLESGVGLLGEYFDNETDLDEEPLFARLDSQLDFAQGASPREGVVPDDFTVRWSGQIEVPTSDEYAFAVLADDLARVWIDGELYIDTWSSPQYWTEGEAIHLEGGQKYDIRVEFRDTGGWASFRLDWSHSG
jgi:mannan endo-1,4-beta-mannosidase